MGGAALKDFGSKRVGREDYFKAKAIVEKTLAAHGVSSYFIPYERSDKSDFGDVDILLAVTEKQRKDIIAAIAHEPSKMNGGVLSWLFSEFSLQIDYIFTSEENFEAYKAFIRHSDFSMFAGRCARLLDLTFGIDGLKYIMRDPETNHETAQIQISKDPKKILPFLGYDYDKWNQDFDNEQDLIEFTFSSSLITRDILKKYSESTKHRKRDLNRGQYHRMEEWFSYREYQFSPYNKFELISKKERLELIFAAFPESDIINKVAAEERKIETARLVREKFSGKDIKEYTGLEGKELGEVIAQWKEDMGPEDRYNEYILSKSIEEIRRAFKIWYSW